MANKKVSKKTTNAKDKKTSVKKEDIKVETKSIKKDEKKVEAKSVKKEDIKVESKVEVLENTATTNNIAYSKYNPLIIKNKFEQKNNNNIYNFFKFSIALSLGIFLLLALWMSTIWQANTISGLGIKLEALNTAGSTAIFTNEQIIEILGGADKIKQPAMNLLDFHSINLNLAWLNSLIAFGFLSLFMLVPVLLFKNGTLLSIISITLGFLFLVIIITLFSMGISEQYQLIIFGRDANLYLRDADQYHIDKLLVLIKDFIYGPTA